LHDPASEGLHPVDREVSVPFADNGDAKIFWREQGHGEPLLLIMGLGYSSDMWHHVEPELAAHFRTIVFDNRGVGKSNIVPGPHLIATMASDAAAVLDAAGVETAHVFGASLGGYIAQEFALQYPRRVRSLILGGTACGGEHTVAAEQEVLDVMKARESMSPERGIRALVPYIYDSKTPVERVEADMAIRLRTYPPLESYRAQLEGIYQWESYDRLEQLQAPTLVIHGEHDQLVPLPNGRLLAEKIPGAQLVILANASHIFFTDRPRETVSSILEFLASHQPNP
jgi:3-oxoadipate enol-lactonase